MFLIPVGLGGALALLVLIVLCRTLAFRPARTAPRTPEVQEVDAARATETLSAMIRCKTISDNDASREEAAEFEKFDALLPTLFPRVYAACERIPVPARAILLRWRGESSDEPTVLMSHFDVVSVEEENWSRPAFEGLVEDVVLWGRGTLDTKATLNGALCAAESLLEKGFTPKRDVFFAFSGNEEVNGNGAPAIVDWLEENGIVPGIVIDEGGAVVRDVFPGVSAPCAMVGIAEKGMLNLQFSVSTNGGHASSPPPHTPVGILSEACCRVENNPFPFRMTPPAAQMFDTLARRSNFLYRMIFANLWLFRGVLDMICRKSGGEMNALVRTTVAFTQMKGSKGMNVLPASASMLANLRLMHGDTVESAMERIKKAVNDDRITLTAVSGNNPSRVSRTDCEAWECVKHAIEDPWEGTIVTPYLMFACSDSRHYGRISDRVYRFSAMAMSREERRSVHGNDERITVREIGKAVEFYLRILANA